MPMPPEMTRYTQQIKCDFLGERGQFKLKNARVLCIGAGGLGSAFLLYLAAAGVGTLGIMDPDKVEITNLHRQILYKTAHLNHDKVSIAKNQLFDLNPHLHIKTYKERLTHQNAREIFQSYDIIGDCSDNFTTHYLINDVCFYLNKPYVFSSVSQLKGHYAFFWGDRAPCFRCLFPSSDTSFPTCNDGGVLGPLVGLCGTLQATEVIKWILKRKEIALSYLLTIDLMTLHFRKILLTKNPTCILCALHKPISQLTDPHALSLKILKEKIEENKNILLLDVRTPQERTLSHQGGLFIPLSELRDRLNELDRCQPIVVYCQTGQRSKHAVKILLEADFQSVWYLNEAFE